MFFNFQRFKVTFSELLHHTNEWRHNADRVSKWDARVANRLARATNSNEDKDVHPASPLPVRGIVNFQNSFFPL